MNHKPEIHWIDPSDSLPAEQLVEAIYEILVEQCVAQEDPYDIYIAHMKSQIYADSPNISQKIAAGYRILLENVIPKK